MTRPSAAFAFFKPAERDGNSLSGEPIRASDRGALILENAIASGDCSVAEIVARGDHHIVVGEVVDANGATEPEGRAAYITSSGLGILYQMDRHCPGLPLNFLNR